ncbi:hypothetical protein [Actinomycetospora lemnae]|uniref:Uncharacterized protein n=1 Tax=Actinomycetospora lemnae TaxID=3019891 RepID=A0ABT5T2S9_9PSEU|nr:hypothetical protein [Actinomycetospora sp. DW7H6]MDD7968522.1 hypothetical protein [Actinomycetospora sp. DW7H6]
MQALVGRQDAGEEPACSLHDLVPCLRGVDGVERRPEHRDELEERVGGRRGALASFREPLPRLALRAFGGSVLPLLLSEAEQAPPIVARHDTRVARDPFPRAARRRPAGRVYRAAGHHREDVAAAEVTLGQREEAEDGGAVRTLDGGSDTAPEEGDVCLAEVFVEEPRVRVGAAVEYRDAVSGPGAQRRHHATNNGPDLVVGIRCVQDGAGGGLRTGELGHGRLELSSTPSRTGVSPHVARQTEDQVQFVPVGEGAQEVDLRRIEVLRQEEHQRPEEVTGDGGGRLSQECCFVVGRRRQALLDGPVDPDGVRGDRFVGLRELVRRVLVDEAQGPVRLSQGTHGPDVIGHRRETTRLLTQHVADGTRQRRSGERPPSCRQQLVSGEDLGNAPQGEHRERGDTCGMAFSSASQGAARGDADAFAGHDEGDLPERILALDLVDDATQLSVRSVAVGRRRRRRDRHEQATPRARS